MAEYRALLLGLARGPGLGIEETPGLLRLRIAGAAAQRLLSRKAPHLLPLWQEAQQELQKFEAYAISHVPRDENRQADDAWPIRPLTKDRRRGRMSDQGWMVRRHPQVFKSQRAAEQAR